MGLRQRERGPHLQDVGQPDENLRGLLEQLPEGPRIVAPVHGRVSAICRSHPIHQIAECQGSTTRTIAVARGSLAQAGRPHPEALPVSAGEITFLRLFG